MDLISTNEVAALLGKGPRTVQRMAAAGKLPATKMLGSKGAYIFNRNDFPTTSPADVPLPPSGPAGEVLSSSPSGVDPEPYRVE